MKSNLNVELLEYLQQAGEEITEGYRQQTGNEHCEFGVIQFSDISIPENKGKADIIRKTAELYDQYKGNEEYIHIPDVPQMSSNFQNFPVIGVVNDAINELEGAMTIKFNDNSQEMDPYYQKEGVKFYSITGAIVRQRENMLNKGLGTGMYETAILGIQRYVQAHPEDNLELNVVIDCTNLPSLYALSNAVSNINSRELVGDGKKLNSNLEAVYTVKDENGHLVEAPTYVLRVDLKARNKGKEDINKSGGGTTISFNVDEEKEKYEKYRQLLDEILEKIKADGNCVPLHMEDKGTGNVTYIPVSSLGIDLTDLRVITNGAEKIGNKRTPRNDSDKFVGPMPNVHIKRPDILDRNIDTNNMGEER